MKRLTHLLVTLLVVLTCDAEVIHFEGTIGGKYPIVMELTQNQNGTLSGKYAYKSTLEKYGANNRNSWLYIHPMAGTFDRWTVKDAKGAVQEHWYDVSMPDIRYLVAKMKNAKGNVYKVEAYEVLDNDFEPMIDLNAYFKSYIGEAPSDIRMFDNGTVAVRMQSTIGYNNYQYLKSIYQTQGGIEYTKGMFWGSAFKAHQCCDPYVVWAYDTDNNCFYVWILKDEREYWWSESGNITYKFRELVGSTI